MEPRGEDELLGPGSVGSYLERRGVIDAPPETVTPLGGGVSNTVLLVTVGERRLVVKQSLPRLRVAEVWLAKRERILTEAAALRLLAPIVPGAVPDVVHLDPSALVLVLESAPGDWQPWKSLLLEGVGVGRVDGRLGEILGTWHQATADLPTPHDPEALRQLRLDPYHGAVAQRHPAVAASAQLLVEQLEGERTCLVHGDFSPKNVLVSPDASGLWVIDLEVAHRGAPVFDVAFLLTHLLLKAVHRPSSAAAMQAGAEGFLTAYRATGAPGADDTARLAAHVGCLLLARVDGRSPVEYLDPMAAGRVRSLALRVLHQPVDAVAEIWDLATVADAPAVARTDTR